MLRDQGSDNAGNFGGGGGYNSGGGTDAFGPPGATDSTGIIGPTPSGGGGGGGGAVPPWEGPIAQGATTAASTLPAWLQAILKLAGVAVPAAQLLASHGSATPGSPLSGSMQDQLTQLLSLMTQRAQSTSPIHAAAMAMANRMAPAYARQVPTAGGGFTGNGTSVPPGSPPFDPNKPVPPQYQT